MVNYTKKQYNTARKGLVKVAKKKKKTLRWGGVKKRGGGDQCRTFSQKISGIRRGRSI